MARCQVEQVKCERCKRVELVPPLPEKKTLPDFEVRLADENGKAMVVKYEDLCSGCKKAIATALVAIKEWDRPIKQQFGPTIHAGAPPLTPAPDYTPPKPHSAAAGKK
jgi:NAD-dependent dihydropyrimidine dehydrogenase PreA subunit